MLELLKNKRKKVGLGWVGTRKENVLKTTREGTKRNSQDWRYSRRQFIQKFQHFPPKKRVQLSEHEEYFHFRKIDEKWGDRAKFFNSQKHCRINILRKCWDYVRCCLKIWNSSLYLLRRKNKGLNTWKD